MTSRPEISTGHFPQFHPSHIYRVSFFLILIPATFISFIQIQPAQGIKCFCFDKERNHSCKGKTVVTCDKGVEGCWHWIKNGMYEGAGCGRHWGNPNISCHITEEDVPEDWCSCEKKDCCNAPDAKPGSCSPVSKKFLEDKTEHEQSTAYWAAFDAHKKAEEVVKQAEGAGSKKAAEAALKKAKALKDKLCKSYYMCARNG